MEKHLEESQDPLLRQSTESMGYFDNQRTKRKYACRQSIRLWLKLNVVSLAAFLLLLYIAVLLTIDVTMKSIEHSSRKRQAIGDSTLLGNMPEFEERAEWTPPPHPFNHGPSDELDAAWADLLHAINIKVSSDEMGLLGVNKKNRVQVNGGDYIGSMGVYHHLHCLNNLRMIVHWDYYEPKYINSPYYGHFGKEHSDHCIDALRQAVMCHANTAITTFEWVDEDNALHGKEQRLEALATCAKWDSVDNWARRRLLIPGNYTYRPGPFERNKPKDKSVG
ncbi:hypothetical protein F4811DRAFT_535399 [Daldinia bambusicola]|nr:hypothetical protein F4811DRAFT_535399 [Daldinia bambusicola]